MNELITVIVPVYNVEQYLDRCLRSIVNQTYENLEILLIDDGSTDNCPQMCDEWVKKDSRIKVLHKSNSGASDARNMALDMAAGEYFYLCDADDYIEENSIEILYNELVFHNADMVIGNYIECCSDGNKNQNFMEGFLDKNECFYYLMEYSHFGILWNRLYKRNLWNGIRFPIGRIHEDVAISYKIINKCRKIRCINKDLYYYCKREESVTTLKFSINQLDYTEAVLDMSLFFYDNNYYELATRSLYLCINNMARGYIFLDTKEEIVKERLLELRSRYKKIYTMVKRYLKMQTIGHRIFMLSLYVHPILLKMLWKMNRRRRGL